MKEFTVGKKDDGLRVDRFLMNRMPEHSKMFLLKAIKTKKIRVNGKHPKKDDRVHSGDKVVSYILNEGRKKERTCHFSVVYEDKHVIIVNKEAGILSEDLTGKTDSTLENEVNDRLKERGERARLCHRIDYNTSGLVVLAKNRHSLDVLNRMFKERRVKKTYVCIVSRCPEKKEGRLEHYLTKNARESLVHVSERPSAAAKTASMEYRVLASNGKLSLVECRLETGRTHQIRCQMAFTGHPLLGDNKYGKKNLNKEYHENRQLLCSCRIAFPDVIHDPELSCLQGKTFQVKDIAFVNRYFPGCL